jgi:flagellar M-ring protein FliF
LLNQLRAILERLTLRQRIIIGVAVVALLGGIAYMVHYQKEKDYKLLFRDMTAEDAGQLTARLKEQNVDFRIGDDGTSIYVRSARVNELRLELAAQGLPHTGRIGFEIFDKTNFALTEFAEQVNYQRALEGELERTVTGIKEVEHARVHLTFAKQSIFESNRQPAKASVVIKLKNGARLSPGSVQAIVFLMSSAVEGLTPEGVSIVDQSGTLLSRPRKSLTSDDEFPEILLEYRQKLEKDLLAKVNSTLAPLLGEDKFRAGITVECDMTSGEASEEIYDPEKAVVTSETKTEDMAGIPLARGVPGTPSNLPRPTSRPASAQTSSQRKSESTNYQASRSIRRTKIPQGQLKRISLSVLLDQGMRWEGVGPKAKRVFDVPSPEKLKAIRDVVSAAVGLNNDRGDQLIVESLPFDATLRIPAPAAPLPPAPPKPLFEIPDFLLKVLPKPLHDPNMLLAAIIGVIAALCGFAAAVWFILRKIKARKTAKAKAAAQKAVAALEAGESVPADVAATLANPELAALAAAITSDDGRTFEERLAEHQDMQKRLEANELARLKMNVVTTQKGKILQQHVTDEAQKDPNVVAQILRSWLHSEYTGKER